VPANVPPGGRQRPTGRRSYTLASSIPLSSAGCPEERVLSRVDPSVPRHSCVRPVNRTIRRGEAIVQWRLLARRESEGKGQPAGSQQLTGRGAPSELQSPSAVQ
jgi:hypothetical protein